MPKISSVKKINWNEVNLVFLSLPNGEAQKIIKQVYYKTPQAIWRFYGYYGGLNTVGNLQTYGQYADDSQFQIVPVLQNKQQAQSFEDAIYTRNSHYSFELKNIIESHSNTFRLAQEIFF